MTTITHHAPDALLAAYAGGSLPQPFALAVAAHISLCLDCRAAYEAHLATGGAVLETASTEAVSDGLKSNVLDLLDAPIAEKPVYQRSGAFPGPVMEALKGKPPRWKSLGMGVRQSILSDGRDGSVRLLYIPQGRAVPDHSHNGLELTLVLQGSFSDETGRFGVGDLEVADQTVEHTPVADAGAPCICLAATDAPLRFNSLIPRLLQPLFRI
ncbi:ChrR family anti-sigma-E factor [Octadecabacter sp. 1_MG-2023]|uniref:ChrR family anti-sigma-E factor n=1 Tax=unclassified Octadecabacter TaxID=196158 RepID=UPI001C0994C1|nr:MULTISPECIES: ChrR family anti-sigma-E factor [unclassified Octadecabacter]MBU2994471.1 ChrR family anti-sigma-E factor [Octadecabacter sp. B2R22]MDO6734238.1 ChrR family anti-sigma-E factor [Octadecabacter sp. 1_MG-2023]